MKAQLKFIMSTGFFKTFICLLIVFLTLPQSAIAVEAEWSKISKNEYIYGYEDKKFACWSLSDKTNLPFIEVLDNGNWYKAADGILLPANSSLETSCTAEFPTAIGYKWSVLRPAPPTNGANRYNIIYRQSLAEIVKITPYSEF